VGELTDSVANVLQPDNSAPSGLGRSVQGVEMQNGIGQWLGAALGAVALIGVAVPAFAQVAQTGQVDRLPGPGMPVGMAGAEGMRIMRPGGLLFASFDRNFDGSISLEELDVGTAGAFAMADKNSDGAISGFEQSDWAKAVGSFSDVMSNPMTFDTDLDRSITPVEFASGLKRIAEPLIDSATGQIAFSDLVQSLRAPREEQAERDPGGRGQGEPRVQPGG
jgi:hypothetical protein